MFIAGGQVDFGGAQIKNLGAASEATDASTAGHVSGVFTYDGANYTLDVTARLFQQLTGNPVPPADDDADMVLGENP